MIFESAGHLLRINVGAWLDSSKNTKVFFDKTEITDGRIHYITKAILREAILNQELSVDEVELRAFILITTDIDPNLGKYQTISFIGPKTLVEDLERSFLTKMKG